MSYARELGRFAPSINASGNLEFADNTGILDSNGNEIILFQEAASAANYLNIGNHSTGNSPYIAAGGSDTNVDLRITPKGIGKVVIGDIEIGPWSSSSSYDGIFRRNAGTNNYLMMADVNHTHISAASATGDIYLRPGLNETALGLNVNVDGTLDHKGYTVHTEENEGAWIAASMLNGWVNYSTTPGYNHAGYRKAADGRIDLRGLIKDGSSGSVFTLPVGYRPLGGIFLSHTEGGNGTTRIDISINGSVTFSAGYSNAFQSLEISFYP